MTFCVKPFNLAPQKAVIKVLSKCELLIRYIHNIGSIDRSFFSGRNYAPGPESSAHEPVEPRDSSQRAAVGLYGM